MNIDEFSRNAWKELRQKGHRTKAERERLEDGYREYYRDRMKSRYPTCCKFWQGMYVQKLTKKLVKRITKQNKYYSEPLKFCPDCGKFLNEKPI